MAAEIQGHPAVELDTGNGQTTMVTVCAHCGQLKTILFLRRDRWYCSACRIEGNAPPNLYPVA
jgi:hypothetical protein